ncbi:hypothetical protein HDU85_004966 [Gaertneriomyces sp. JEL0708]|nr:hypothetical protein HDU85_004966 [Gaertneriomyces sp. JEL0708]
MAGRTQGRQVFEWLNARAVLPCCWASLRTSSFLASQQVRYASRTPTRKPKSTHKSRHTGAYPGYQDPTFQDYNPPAAMSRNAARKWAKVAPKKEKIETVTPATTAARGKERVTGCASACDPNVEQRTLKVELEEHDVRLDRFLQQRLRLPKHIARLKILNHEVAITGSAHARFVDLKPTGQLHAGDVVLVTMPKAVLAAQMTKEQQTSFQQQLDDEVARLKRNILYKDDQILIINKPRGLPVQGGSRAPIHVDMLLDAFRFGKEEGPRLVHRLDKDTTGVLLLARTKDSAVRLSKYFSSSSDRLIKRYMAIVSSPIKEDGVSASEGDGDDIKTITTGIVKVRTGDAGLEKMTAIEWHDGDNTLTINAQAKKAVTRYRLVASSPVAALLELNPLTGRKNQLRVHCSMILKSPILGDYKYGCPKNFKGNTHRLPLHLHLQSITLKDWYGAGADLHVSAPLPPHMTNALEELKLVDDI